MSIPQPSTLVSAPMAPSAQARNPHHPLDLREVRIGDGFWGQWQRINRATSLRLGIDQLEEAGNFADLRLAAGEADGQYRGPVYMDSDVYKLLETAVWELASEPDFELTDFTEQTTELLERAQTGDGYLNSYYQTHDLSKRYTQLMNSHELYCAGHLVQAAVAARRSVGDERLLGVARRFADHLVDTFLPITDPPLDGHPGVETALVELYRLTNEDRYLKLATRLVNERGRGLAGYSPKSSAYFQDHVPVREMRTLVGHAVRALYLEAGIVDVSLETGDTSLLNSSVARWEDMVAARTAITGGLGARQLAEAFGERFELPSDQAYNETCSAMASVHWSWRLLLATGEARYADLIERTLYNAFAASTSSDGRAYFKGNPVQRRADHADAIGDPKCRGEWFWSACCPPNVTRLVSSLGHYLATTAPNTLYLHQFTQATLSPVIDGDEVAVLMETDYPWHGTVRITFQRTPGTGWTLALRIPSWSADTQLLTNGDEQSISPDRKGYQSIERNWQPGDTVTLHLDMRPRLTVPHPRIDGVRGCRAIERGPLVYCVEQVDQPVEVEVDDLVLPAQPRFEVVDHHLPTIGRTVTIHTPAWSSRFRQPPGLPYYDRLPNSRREPTSVTAIPYFQWANRDAGAMRVWLPLDEPWGPSETTEAIQ